jgi:hypothetical protein
MQELGLDPDDERVSFLQTSAADEPEFRARLAEVTGIKLPPALEHASSDATLAPAPTCAKGPRASADDAPPALEPVSSDTVLGWIRSGGLRAIDVTASGNGMRRHFRITEEALQEFLGSREVRCSPSPRAAPARRRRGTGSEQEEPIKDYFPE